MVERDDVARRSSYAAGEVEQHACMHAGQTHSGIRRQAAAVGVGGAGSAVLHAAGADLVGARHPAHHAAGVAATRDGKAGDHVRQKRDSTQAGAAAAAAGAAVLAEGVHMHRAGYDCEESMCCPATTVMRSFHWSAVFGGEW
jgi:hypothetical protein